MLVKETIDGIGVLSLAGQIGGLGFAARGVGLAAGVQFVPLSEPGRWPLPQMPALSVPAGVDLTSATALPSQWVTSNISTLEHAFSLYEAQYGLSCAWLAASANAVHSGALRQPDGPLQLSPFH